MDKTYQPDCQLASLKSPKTHQENTLAHFILDWISFKKLTIENFPWVQAH